MSKTNEINSTAYCMRINMANAAISKNDLTGLPVKVINERGWFIGYFIDHREIICQAKSMDALHERLSAAYLKWQNYIKTKAR